MIPTTPPLNSTVVFYFGKSYFFCGLESDSDTQEWIRFTEFESTVVGKTAEFHRFLVTKKKKKYSFLVFSLFSIFVDSHIYIYFFKLELRLIVTFSYFLAFRFDEIGSSL